MSKPAENLKKKTKDNDWCPMCGGGGGEMKRTPEKDLSRPLEYHECTRCKGAGVVDKVKVKRN